MEMVKEKEKVGRMRGKCGDGGVWRETRRRRQDYGDVAVAWLCL